MIEMEHIIIGSSTLFWGIVILLMANRLPNRKGKSPWGQKWEQLNLQISLYWEYGAQEYIGLLKYCNDYVPDDSDILGLMMRKINKTT